MSINVFAGQADLAAPNDPLVGVDDFSEWFSLGSPDAAATARINTALEIASAAIRTKTKQQITVITETITFEVWNTEFVLPESPVTAIQSLTIDSVDIPAYDPQASSQLGAYTWSPPGASIRILGGWRGYGVSAWGGIGGTAWVRPAVVTLTYTHGWNPIPRDLAGVCLSVAKRLYDNPSGGEVQSETLGSWSVQYAQPTGTGFSAYEDEILSRYTAWTIGS